VYQFIHGCAVLLPEDVQAQPYWIDDVTLKDSIEASGALSILDKSLGANQHYQHLLPHDELGNPHMPRKNLLLGAKESSVLASASAAAAEEDDQELEEYGLGWAGAENGCWGGSGLQACIGDSCDWAAAWKAPRITGQKVETKLFLANERTFIKWLHMAVIIASFSIGVLAFSASDSQSHKYAIIMLPVALLIDVYAIVTYVWRSRLIRTRSSERWDDPMGPVLLTGLLVLALLVQFFLKLAEVLKGGL
jgi:uncharacterized membrane protein YidH (DUF202 family)